MSKSRRSQRPGKAPKKSAPILHVDDSWLEPARGEGAEPETSPPARGAPRNTIPVQADWLEADEPKTPPRDAVVAPRPGPKPGPQQRPPPLPALSTDYLEGAQRALQRLQALHPTRDGEKLVDELQKKLARSTEAGHARVSTRHGHVVIQIAVDTLFAPGDATPKPAGVKALGVIAAALSSMVAERFQVEGHARGARPADFSLSASRAMAVARWLASSGIASTRISVAAFAALDPQAPAEHGGLAVTILRGETAPTTIVDNR